MTTAQIGILISICIYLMGMLIVGFAASRNNNDVGDFYLGGRRLGPFVTAMSAEASDMSSYLLMGVPGLAYFSGVADAGWTCFGLAVGTYLNWLFTAKRLLRNLKTSSRFTSGQVTVSSKRQPRPVKESTNCEIFVKITFVL